jgi:hypothetical protein
MRWTIRPSPHSERSTPWRDCTPENRKKETMSYQVALGRTFASPPPTMELLCHACAALDASRSAARSQRANPTSGCPDCERLRSTEGAHALSAAVEDDGIIDLGALGCAPPRSNQQPVAPLFGEIAPVAVDLENASSSGNKSRARSWVVGASLTAGLLAVAGFGVSHALKSEAPMHPAAIVATAPPVAEAAPPSPVASAEPQAVPAAKASTATPKAARGKSGASKGPAPSKASTVKPRSSDPCGCKGDFNCVLRCTAKGGK